MIHRVIDGYMFAQMIRAGASNLKEHVKTVDALNVFPVPDGDTGTNMNLSFTSGVNEMNKVQSPKISEVAKALSRGLLMGARGNSGVILSQLFRGFSKHVEEYDEINVKQFTAALKKGVETAYKAVMKPVEGTILTVSKDAAAVAEKWSRNTDDIAELMTKVLEEAKASLKRTPDLLPILKQVGVVDSGGQGLVYVYEGFVSVLTGKEIKREQQSDINATEISENKEEHVHNEVAEMMAAGVLSVEDIEFGYCTEFMIRMNESKAASFNEEVFRQQLSKYGDSLLVISDDELVKVHIHAEELFKVMELAQGYGGLTNIKIENMREQFLAIKEQEASKGNAAPEETKEYGIIAVAMGPGIEDMFKNMGVDVVIQGGQTMNPSTEDFVKAIKSLRIEQAIILPNNSNIILAAEQAAELVDIPVRVVPCKNVPHGITALLHFSPSQSLEENSQAMTQALEHVAAGQVTYAVRDTEIDGLSIKKGDYMGIANGKIVTTAEHVEGTIKELIQHMVDEDSEVLTLIYGEDVSEEEAQAIVDYIEEHFEDVEVELHYGGQPLYAYLISVE